MKIVEPKIFLLAETSLRSPDISSMIKALGVTYWFSDYTDDSAGLVEFAGRLCYKSFEVGLNPNVTKVREGNKNYIGNLLKQRHGSVLEHASATIGFVNVSRIFTHEHVRHRAGVAYSQESMRFVRMDDLPLILPDLTEALSELSDYLVQNNFRDTLSDEGNLITEDNQDAWADYAQCAFKDAFFEAARHAEAITKKFGQLLDTPGVPFHLKKTITSALRRIAPGGHATHIICTANHRAWRHMIAQRTSAGAEYEIVQLFNMVAELFAEKYPTIYQDMSFTPHELFDDCRTVVFDNDKV